MGVAGLWDILRPAGQTRSLTHLAVVDGFEKNLDGIRGFRIGIDTSIWFFHAANGKEGENPELRTLFFRCATLMRAPFLPLFVFDGPKRPSVKRGKKVSGNAHWLATGMKNIIEAFGFEWRTAPGEAEAELAYLNQIGVIDGILSDDVDNFLFGATMVIRNASNTLSGNRANPTKNSAGKDDKNHSVIYHSKDLLEHPDIGLTRGGLILIGLLSGGDYHQAGLARCGIKIAHGLAKCGFGDSLYNAALTMTRQELSDFLIMWREELRHELLTNSQRIVGKKLASLAKSIPDDFPNIDIVLSYTNPITSETEGRAVDNLRLTWSKEPDLGKLANICELYFEWGVKDIIIKRFRTVIWPSAVLRILRRRVLDSDNGHCPSSTSRIGKSTASSDDEAENERLVVKIHSTRTHASTDGILEYRLEISPAQLVDDCEAGISGIRPPIEDDEWDDEEDKKVKKPPPDPLSHIRIWIPASLVQPVEPALVNEFECIQDKRRAKTAGKGRGKKVSKAKAAALTSDGSASEGEPLDVGEEDGGSSSKKKRVPKAKVKGKAAVAAAVQEDEDVSSDSNKNPKGKGAPKNVFKTRIPNEPFDDDLRKDLKSFYPVSKGTTHSAKQLGSKAVKKSNSSALPTLSRNAKPALVNEPTVELSDFYEFPSSARPLAMAASKYSATASRPSSSQNGGYVPVPASETHASLLPVVPQPKPFPIGFKDDDHSRVGDPFIESSNTRPLISPRKQSRQISLLSSPEYDTLTRLPRVSTEHSSPRSKRTSKVGEREQGQNPLLNSPSRRSRLTTKPSTSKSMGVIEISSDSDTPPLTSTTRAKAKQPEQLSQKSSREPTKLKKAGLPMPERTIDFIDLT